MKLLLIALLAAVVLVSCKSVEREDDRAINGGIESQFDWNAANVYFLLTDRFYNGDFSNDNIVPRNETTATLRGFEGGDFTGITQKLEENYFTDLGINAIWLTPIVEQVKGGVDEGTGFTYAYHGYWAKDWTAIEPAYGTLEEFQKLVTTAHSKNIRVLMDIVINHTGPVTDQDPQWPLDWVRTEPTCMYQDQETAVSCTLTNNLPDIRTDSKEEVELPEILVNKWKNEGRYEQEVAELNSFFEISGLDRTPVNYIIKWVTDYARETGVDGFRIDTVKHVEETVWTTFIEQSRIAYNTWKEAHPDEKIHDDEFFIVGELYGYYAQGGRSYNFNENKVDYFDSGYDAMINFGFKDTAKADYSTIFKDYAQIKDSLSLEKPADPVTYMNYISSHDDGQPFDPLREKSLEAGTKLLLTPGISQVYYGDETARILKADGAVGDANLRTNMNWNNIDQSTLKHWQLLGRFRRDHPAVGAGQSFDLKHTGRGFISGRIYEKNSFQDNIIIGVGLPDGVIQIDVNQIFKDATTVRNAYTGKTLAIDNGKVNAQAVNGVILLESI